MNAPTLSRQAVFPNAALVELALGIDNDADIAARHKLTARDIQWARNYHAAEIARLSAELRDSGLSFRRKNALCAEDIIERLYAKALDPNIGVGSLLEVYRTFAKYGELEPKENAIQAGAGTGFAINIVVNGQAVNNTAKVIEHEPVAYSPPDFDALTILSPPAFLDSADITVNDELTALPQEVE